MSAITPNPEQFKAFADASERDDGPVVMLNLLKFKAGDGAQEYATYAGFATKMVEESGGRIVYSGRVDQALVGESGEWDMIALVEYPNRKAFLAMVSRPDYQKASEHREAGLERTVLIATTQADRLGQA